jgi:branched-chain amino acid transport system ATP-binding protein
MLRADQLVAGYDGAPVIHDIRLDIAPGEIVCLLGANGAGKTTLAKTLAGLLHARAGQVTIGDLDLTFAPPDRRVRHGLSLVPEGRHLFGRATVRDNIVLGGYTRTRSQRNVLFDSVMGLFPQLPPLLLKRARDLSGGEQQMVALARALMAEPRYLILDEPSLGLSPLYVDAVLSQAQALAGRGVGVLLIEQNVSKALAIAHRAAVVETGRLVLTGTAADLMTDSAIVDSYLGSAS